MRLLRYVLVLICAVCTLGALYVFYWFRERYGRGGPIPVSQARTLLNPRREWIHPVSKTLEKFRISPDDTVLEIGPGRPTGSAGSAATRNR